MRPLAVVAAVICGVAAFGLAVTTFMDVSMAGFPDGHVTDFDSAAGGPLTVLAWVEAGLGLLFLALAFVPISARARTIGLLAVFIVFVLAAVASQVGIPWYFGTHLGLDNGIGG